MTTATSKQVEVKEKGLILSNAKVLAILDGRKTQERIPLKVPTWLKKMQPDLSTAFAGKACGVTPCLFVGTNGPMPIGERSGTRTK